jgi:hypothetical protein
MRLFSVRDWLQGQGWFDMSNNRVLPPEGVSLHWSRYVDLGIAGVITGLSLFLPYEQAEALSTVVWPSLLLVAFLTLTMVTARKLFGPCSGGRRHHRRFVARDRAELLRTTGARPSRCADPAVGRHRLHVGDRRFGNTARPCGGHAAALSLAVGLENLLPIVAGMILAVLAVAPGDRGQRQLPVFGATLAIAALILHMGQTARTEWMLVQCDELGPPFLGLLGIAALASLAIAVAAARFATLQNRVAISGAVALAAGVAALQIMAVCPNMPYGNLPDDIRQMISDWIVEARPASFFISTGSPLAFSHLLPTFAATVAATGLLAWRWRNGTATEMERRAVSILLVFAWIGTLGMLTQVRMAVLSAPVIPLLIGYAVVALMALRHRVARPSLVSLAIVGVLATCVMPAQLHLATTTIAAAHAADGNSQNAQRTDTNTCRRAEIIASLNDLPTGSILSPLSLAPPILYTTSHTVVAAPYHRSAEALGNGLRAFIGDEDAFFATVDRARPDYIVMCAGGHYGDESTYVNVFARGEAVDGFEPLAGFHDDLIVLEVTR